MSTLLGLSLSIDEDLLSMIRFINNEFGRVCNELVDRLQRRTSQQGNNIQFVVPFPEIISQYHRVIADFSDTYIGEYHMQFAIHAKLEDDMATINNLLPQDQMRAAELSMSASMEFIRAVVESVDILMMALQDARVRLLDLGDILEARTVDPRYYN